MEALKWYRQAVSDGSIEALVNLGGMYADGRGLRSDIGEAQGLREAVANRMTPEQIGEAQRLTRECVAKEYEGC